MPKKRSANSKYPFSGLALEPAEEKVLIAILEKKEISCKRVLRMLIRDWIAENKKIIGICL